MEVEVEVESNTSNIGHLLLMTDTSVEYCVTTKDCSTTQSNH